MIKKNKKIILYLLEKLNVPYEQWLYKDSPGKYHKKIYPRGTGNKVLSDLFQLKSSFMVSRIGETEMQCTRWFLKYRQHKKVKSYPDVIKYKMANNAGFFPARDEMLDKFCDLFLEGAKNIDILGVWYNKGESLICKDYCPNASLIQLHDLNPYVYQNPWSSQLEGKTVLVVHPFVDTIREQYKHKRSKIFEDSSVLPLFNLKTLRAVQSIAGSRTPFEDWFAAYSFMCDEIIKIDFDVAIIGAGAYGLPLASFVKNLGKTAIHMGGVTQLLFGIKGKRWEDPGYFGWLMNEHWVRPAEHEKPREFNNVESGCYW